MPDRILLPRARMHSKGLVIALSVCLSVDRSVWEQRNIETAKIRGYSLRKGYNSFYSFFRDILF